MFNLIQFSLVYIVPKHNKSHLNILDCRKERKRKVVLFFISYIVDVDVPLICYVSL